MKNSNNKAFDQHYNVQVAVDHESRLIPACSLSNHPNDKRELEATLEELPQALGKPGSVSLDNGFFSEENIKLCEGAGIEPFIAVGRQSHHRSWKSFFEEEPEPPGEDASATMKMAYKLKTELGKAIYRLRKCTVEPVIGIIKEIMGFRQFSLRGLEAAEGEWCLVCLAYNLKRMHVMINGRNIKRMTSSPTAC